MHPQEQAKWRILKLWWDSLWFQKIPIPRLFILKEHKWITLKPAYDILLLLHILKDGMERDSENVCSMIGFDICSMTLS